MKTLFTTLAVLACSQLNAQVNLPYTTGFDTATEQNGWTEYQSNPTTLSHWSVSPANPGSAPNCISHGYAPASGLTVVDNWYVSPSFEIPSGGNLDSIRYTFPGLSVPGDGDTVAVYLLQGSQNPANATKILLSDFRGADYVADNTYRAKYDIPLTASNGDSYIAIRYRNSNASAIWLTVNFDDIAISSNSSAGLSKIHLEPQLSVYPIPANDIVTLKSTSENIQAIKLFDLNGKCVRSLSELNKSTVDINLSELENGNYILKVQTEQGITTKEIVVTK